MTVMRIERVEASRGDGEVNKKGTTLRGTYLLYRDALHECMQYLNKDAATFKEEYNKKFEGPAHTELFGGGQLETPPAAAAGVEMSEVEKLSNYLSLGSL